MLKLFLIEGIKMKWMDLKIFFYLRFFHKRHVFKREEAFRPYDSRKLMPQDDESPKCIVCGVPLDQLTTKDFDEGKIKIACLALFLLAMPARPDSFVGAKDTTFYRGTPYVFRVAVASDACLEARPCIVQVEDDKGRMADQAGTYAGRKGDTAAFTYDFPEARYAWDTKVIRLSLWTPYGTSLGGWNARLGYADPKPVLARREAVRPPRDASMPWRFRLDGRAF